MNRWHLLALSLAAGAIHLALAIATAKPLDLDLLKNATAVASAMAVLVVAFDWWIWRLPIWHPWFAPQPNINGTWKVDGELWPSWR